MDVFKIIDMYDKKIYLQGVQIIRGYYTFSTYVYSAGFCGKASLCIPEDKLKEHVKVLSTMHKELKGVISIKSFESDTHFIIEMGRYGHLFIAGQIGASHRDHYMKFKMESDQTILPKIVLFIRSLLEES